MTKAPPKVGGNPIIDNLDLWTSSLLAKMTAGRSSSGKLEAYGITKLRELILELAVRGKLVPQDPNDESASELVERIRAERNLLESTQKTKSLPPIPVEELPYDIPADWTFARLGELVDVFRGITFPASEKSKVPAHERVACLRTSNIQERIVWDDILYIRTSFVNKEEQFLRKNDILMSMANSRELVGKVAIVDLEPATPTTFGGFLSVLRPTKIEPRYMMALLRSPLNRSALIDSASQTTNIANISLGRLNPLVLAIPPLGEQHRIVAKVDELMALCDQLEQQQTDGIAAHQGLVETLLGTLASACDHSEFQEAWTRIAEHFDILFTTENRIEQLKQSILQLAVTGKLVPQDPNDGPASALLQRIVEEKARLVANGKLKKAKARLPVSDQEKHFELPAGWIWTRFADLTLHSEAGWSPSCHQFPRQGESWGVLKVSAVTWGKYDSTENKALPRNLEPRPELEVMPSDFLISRANTAELVARAVVVPEGAPPRLMMSDKIIRFVFGSALNRQYLALVNGSTYARRYYARVAGGTSSSMKNVSREQILNLVVALPPRAEQERIMEKVEELISICEALKMRLAEAQTTQIHLADAIVAQAVA